MRLDVKQSQSGAGVPEDSWRAAFDSLYWNPKEMKEMGSNTSEEMPIQQELVCERTGKRQMFTSSMFFYMCWYQKVCPILWWG